MYLCKVIYKNFKNRFVLFYLTNYYNKKYQIIYKKRKRIKQKKQKYFMIKKD